MANTIRLNRRQVQHLVTVLVAVVLIATAMTSSWWTRGYTASGDFPDDDDFGGNIAETFTVSYGPFDTPNFGPFQFDSVRETAVTVTGVLVLLSAVFAMAYNFSRWGIDSGRLEMSADTPIKFAIVAFVLGITGVLLTLLWPFMGGVNQGIFASETLFEGTNPESGDQFYFKSQEFLNVGFFMGIFAFIIYPAYLWLQEEAIRSESSATTGTAA